MVETQSIDALRSALAPVEAMRGEHSQLESWVLESFASLETLHTDLADWQRELARRQAELDQREAAVADAEGADDPAGEAVARLDEQLVQAREEVRQLEEENADQLQAIDDLDRQLVAAQTELRVVRKHSEELAIALETERERSIDEHRHWTGELKEMRRLLERQGDTLAWLAGGEPTTAPGDQSKSSPVARVTGGEESAPAADMAARAAELRRRASTRRAANRRTT